jgi:Flp pilus assembly protein TadG
MPTCNSLKVRTATFAARLRQEAGQALVEFAVVLPVLMLIIMGIIYFGRYESYSNQMTQLAEIGARNAAVDFTPSSGTLAAYIASQATGELANSGSQDVSALSVRVQCYSSSGTSASSCTAGGSVKVCTTATVQFPFLSIKAGTIAQRATMLVEQAGESSSSTSASVPTC